MNTILLIEDEPHIRRILAIALKADGFDVALAESAFAAKHWVKRTTPSAIVLDLGLPDEDGQELIPRLRQHCRCPILVLSARDQTRDKVNALDSGAQDYMTKPFSIEELTARLRALLRDTAWLHRTTENNSTLVNDGLLSVDLKKREVRLEQKTIELTRKEYEVLEILTQTPNQVVTQQQILCDIWGPAHAEDTHYLRIVISHLRRKLHTSRNARDYIITEQGIGYRLAITQSAS